MTYTPPPFVLDPRPARAVDDAPLPGATFGQAVARFYRRYAMFSGRASRSEYWWIALLYTCVSVVGLVVLGMSDPEPGEASPFVTLTALLVLLFVLGGAVPCLALNARRLHDANLSGWLQLVSLVPTVGPLVMTVLALLPSKPEGAVYDR